MSKLTDVFSTFVNLMIKHKGTPMDMPTSIDFEALLLAGKIDEPLYRKIGAAATSHWGAGYADDPANRRAVDAVVFQRHDNTVRHVMPWINRVSSIADRSWIDYGCGCGSSSLALSRIAPFVDSYEIFPPSVAAYQVRMEAFGVQNTQIHTGPPETLVDDAVANIGPDTSVLLLAVVEHLLEAERVDYLTKIWDALAPGQVLVIVETPNFAACFDTHTFHMPFIHMASDEVIFPYLKTQPSSLRFRDPLVVAYENEGITKASQYRKRYGVGCTHHLFEVAFGRDLNEVVVADGFDQEMLSWFNISPDDTLLLSAFDLYKIEAPVGFAKNVLSFVFRKPISAEQAAETTKWNVARKEEIIAKYALSRKKDLAPSS